MTILYSTATLFTLKKSDGQDELENQGEDDFQTDDDDMEVSDQGEEKQGTPKRKKVSSALVLK